MKTRDQQRRRRRRCRDTESARRRSRSAPRPPGPAGAGPIPRTARRRPCSRARLTRLTAHEIRIDEADIERKEAGPRPSSPQPMPTLHAAVDPDQREERHGRRPRRFRRSGGTDPSHRFRLPFRFITLPQVILRSKTTCRRLSWSWRGSRPPSSGLHAASLRSRPTWRTPSPVMKVWLKAPSLISFFHSGVSRTFLNRST